MGLFFCLVHQFLPSNLGQLQAEKVRFLLCEPIEIISCSVEGYHLDYPFLNFSGYIFYSTCCTFGFFWKNNHYGMGTVRLRSYFFANKFFRLQFKTWYLLIIHCVWQLFLDFNVFITR